MEENEENKSKIVADGSVYRDLHSLSVVALRGSSLRQHAFIKRAVSKNDGSQHKPPSTKILILGTPALPSTGLLLRNLN